MKRHRALPVAAGEHSRSFSPRAAEAITRAHSHSSKSAQTFTYDTYTPVMIDGWDPATEYSNGIIAMSHMYQTLTHYNSATHQIQPELATSWNSSDSGLTWTFQLRHGVHFHTGRLMTAQAAAAAILRTIKENGGAAYIWGAVKTIDAPSEYTLVFHLKYASPLDLEASADYSAYIYDTQAAGSGGNLTKWLNTPHDAGTGPYTLQTWNSGQEFEVILKAYSGYWGGWSGAHYKRVVFRVVPQDTTAVQLLKSGQVTFIEQMSPTLWNSLKGTPGLQAGQRAVVAKPARPAQYAGAQPAGAPGHLVRHRLQGHDRRPVRRGDRLQRHRPGRPARPLHRPAQLQLRPGQGQDPAERGGYGPGKKAMNLSLTYTQGDTNEVVATLMKSDLAKLNINLSVQSLSSRKYQRAKGKSSTASQHQDIFMEYSVAGLRHPYSWFINLLYTESPPYFNLSYYSDKTLDGMINKVEPLVATDRTAAEQLYKEMQVRILGTAPILFLYNSNYQYAMQNNFTGLQVNPAYPNVVFVYDLKPTGS